MSVEDEDVVSALLVTVNLYKKSAPVECAVSLPNRKSAPIENFHLFSS